MVNDGSTDESLNLVEKYSNEDSRLRVFSKQNGGLSSARNYGLLKSRGNYIVYVDSDDYVSQEYIMNLYRAIKPNNSDVAVSKFCLVDDAGTFLKKYSDPSNEITIMNSDTSLKELFLQKKFDNSAWGKMYKRELSEAFPYPDGKLFEDLPVTYKIFMKASSVAYIDSYDYYYVQRSNSITGSSFNKKKLDLLIFLEELVDNEELKARQLELYAKTRAFASLTNLWRNIPIADSNNKLVWNLMKKYRVPVITLRDSKLKLKLGVLLTLFGRNLMSKIISNVE